MFFAKLFKSKANRNAAAPNNTPRRKRVYRVIGVDFAGRMYHTEVRAVSTEHAKSIVMSDGKFKGIYHVY